MSDNTTDTGKPLTGGKVFAIFAGAFALVLGVNLFMATMALGTFSGLEVQNSYVASQVFDAEREAQEALGWTSGVNIVGDEVVLTLTGMDGKPAPVAQIEASLGRATVRDYDQDLTFTQNENGDHVAPIKPIDGGRWELRYVATAANGVPFRQHMSLYVLDR